MAFSGVRSFSGMETGGSRVCSIVSCTGDTLDSCGRRFTTYTANATAIFEELSILAAFPTPIREPGLDADDSAIFPVALKTSIMPLEPKGYSYDIITDGRLTYFNLTLNDFGEELYSFAIWGRVYATDGQEADPPLVGEPNETTAAPHDVAVPGAAHIHFLSSILLISALAFLQF